MSNERVQRGMLELDRIADEHGLGQSVSRQMAQALTAIGPEELGRLMYAARAVDDLRQFVDLARGALEVAESLAAEDEARAGRDLLSGGGVES